MRQQYFQADPVLPVPFRGNTGDGIRMAQDVGAALWHMWHYHGPYGLRHPDPSYPFGLLLKAIPMWTPGRSGQTLDLATGEALGRPAGDRGLARMPWILVDQTGRRFMDEYPPYPGDFGVRPLDLYDSKTQRFPRIPAYMIFDEAGRKLYPFGRVVGNERQPIYQWSDDNLEEVKAGIFQRADTIAGLARQIGAEPQVLEATIDRWNRFCTEGRDEEQGRAAETMMPVSEPPFYKGAVWPIVLNTQGGPVHDARQRVIDPFGQPIPRLYAAGELGSAFGHVYLAGGNLAECFVGGRIAAREAAALSPWDDER